MLIYDYKFLCELIHCCFRIEKSTDQVIKPVNLEALTKWAASFPADLRSSARAIAPMLVRLGYDPDAYPPEYGQADSFVANNTLLIKHNEEYWLKQALAAQQLTKTLVPDVIAAVPGQVQQPPVASDKGHDPASPVLGQQPSNGQQAAMPDKSDKPSAAKNKKDSTR